MASTFTSRFKLEKMETGANANTWGTRTNNNLDVVDAFGGGYLAKSVAGSADVTLTQPTLTQALSPLIKLLS
ncbi:MAG: hypothetical protein CM15mV49_800 [uncultured marine virus]|nr:MAG: hypothetical protein CM15mV49_800 [uncultured marine virus]